MKWIVSSGIMAQRLAILGRVISGKNTIEVLNSFLFVVEGDELQITATDAEISLSTRMGLVMSEGDMSFTIDAKIIQEALRSIPDQPVEFKLNEETFEMSLTYQNGIFNIMANRGDIYPVIEDIEGHDSELHLDAKKFTNGVERALCAISEDHLRPIMNGVYFDVDEKDVTIVASDAQVLTYTRFAHNSMSGKKSVSLPKKPASMVKALYSREEGELVMRYNSQNAAIVSEHYTMRCRLTEGRFPAYREAMPKNNDKVLKVNREAFLSALRRISVFADAGSELVRLQLSANSMTLTAQDLGFSQSAEESLMCEYNDQAMSIGLKSSSVIDVINVLQCDELMFKFMDPSRPGIIEPVEQLEGEETVTLMMPLMVID